MNKITALWQLFHKGQAVANPAAWKKGQITATALGAVIMGVINVLAAFGYAVPVDPATANNIAVGILAVTNVVLTITTTDKVGLPVRGAPAPETGSIDAPGFPLE